MTTKKLTDYRWLRLPVALIIAFTMVVSLMPSTAFVFAEDEESGFEVFIKTYSNNGFINDELSNQLLPNSTFKLHADIDDRDDDADQATYTYNWSFDTEKLEKVESNSRVVEYLDKENELDKAFADILDDYTSAQFLIFDDETDANSVEPVVSVREMNAVESDAEKLGVLYDAVRRGFCVQVNLTVTKMVDGNNVGEASTKAEFSINNEYAELRPVNENLLADLGLGQNISIVPKFYYYRDESYFTEEDDKNKQQGIQTDAKYKWVVSSWEEPEEILERAENDAVRQKAATLNDDEKAEIAEKYKKDTGKDFDWNDPDMDYLKDYFGQSLITYTWDNIEELIGSDSEKDTDEDDECLIEINKGTTYECDDKDGTPYEYEAPKYRIWRFSKREFSLILFAISPVWPYRIERKVYRVDEILEAPQGGYNCKHTDPAGNTVIVSVETGTVSVTSVNKKAKSVTIPDTEIIGGKVYNVTTIGTGAFKGARATRAVIGRNITRIMPKAFNKSKVRTITVKSTRLTRRSVKNALKGSKVKTVKVKAGSSKKETRKYVRKYKKIFTRSNAGKKAAVK